MKKGSLSHVRLITIYLIIRSIFLYKVYYTIYSKDLLFHYLIVFFAQWLALVFILHCSKYRALQYDSILLLMNSQNRYRCISTYELEIVFPIGVHGNIHIKILQQNQFKWKYKEKQRSWMKWMNEWKNFFWFRNMSQIAFPCYQDFIKKHKMKDFPS